MIWLILLTCARSVLPSVAQKKNPDCEWGISSTDTQKGLTASQLHIQLDPFASNQTIQHFVIK